MEKLVKKTQQWYSLYIAHKRLGRGEKHKLLLSCVCPQSPCNKYLESFEKIQNQGGIFYEKESLWQDFGSYIDGKEITMTIGKVLEAYGVAPQIINSRTYVPIRFVADELGSEVNWNEETKEITIVK